MRPMIDDRRAHLTVDDVGHRHDRDTPNKPWGYIMTIKTICLVQVFSETHVQEAAFEYALDLAADHEAHLSICIAVPVIVIPMDYPVAIIGTIQTDEEDRRLALAQQQAETMRKKASINGVNASIDVVQNVFDSILERFAAASRVHDLSITEGLEDAFDFQSDVLQTLLSQSGGPVLVIPRLWRKGSKTATIVAAWDASAQCARALRFATGYLKPSVKVEILSVEERSEPSNDDPWQSIATRLAPHFSHLTANTIPRLDGSVGKAIHNHAKLSKADLIVMGAYGHSRFREWVLGGATREMLQRTDVPLFMAH